MKRLIFPTDDKSSQDNGPLYVHDLPTEAQLSKALSTLPSIEDQIQYLDVEAEYVWRNRDRFEIANDDYVHAGGWPSAEMYRMLLLEEIRGLEIRRERETRHKEESNAREGNEPLDGCDSADLPEVGNGANAPDGIEQPGADDSEDNPNVEIRNNTRDEDKHPTLREVSNKRNRWGPLAEFIDKAMATTTEPGQPAEARRLWALIKKNPEAREYCESQGIDEDYLLGLASTTWSGIRRRGFEHRKKRG